jgi:tripartite-type tricarboxylate transporter receptor subunit TctC
MLRLLAVVFATGICWSASAFGQDWPVRPVRLIVPFGAGGTGDALARIVSDHLSASLKQQFVVENRTGAGGMIGVQALAASAPDGYTFGITNVSTLSLIPVINPKQSYHPLKDFTHVAYVAGAPVSLAVFPKTGIKTLKEFIAYARKSPKPLTFASSGLGSDGHLIGEAIAASTGIKVQHVPYKSTGQALTDVVGGHVTFSTFTLSSSSSFIRAGTITGIAVTSPSRMPDYPDLPTFKELGYPDLVASTWFSISGPAKLSKIIAERLNRAINAAMAKPEVQARMRRDGLLTQAMTPEEFTRFVAAESARWTPLVERAGLAGKGG